MTHLSLTTKPSDLYARDREWAELSRAWRSGRPELILVVGRRRAGKSYLLTRFVREHHGVYYQATRQTESEQRRALAEAVGHAFDEPAFILGATPTWEALFEYLAARARSRPVTLVLDEFTYLSDAVPALPSIIQRVWDHTLPGTKLKVVLSGSYISAMTRLTHGDQPLFGRRTSKLLLAPLNYRDAASFYPNFSVADRLRCAAIVGGLPGYASRIDDRERVADNVARLVLDPTSALHDEALHVFDTFLADAEIYYSVVDAIANGNETWGGIANRIGKAGSSLSRPLEWLQDMDVVQRVVPITDGASGRGSGKRARYRLRDPYLRFWYRFVRPIRTLGLGQLVSPEQLWTQYVAPGLADFLGPAFEDVCREFVAIDGGRQLPFAPVRLGEWWSMDSTRQVDVVAIGGKQEVLIGECKSGRVTSADVDTLVTSADVVARELGAGRVEKILFVATPVRGAQLARRLVAEDVQVITAEAMFMT